jgi:hypothetical protein
MTLGGVRDALRNMGGKPTNSYNQWADAIDAHLAQPVQAVDVGALIRDVCETDPADPNHMDTVCINVDQLRQIVELHTRAIGNAQAEGK